MLFGILSIILFDYNEIKMRHGVKKDNLPYNVTLFMGNILFLAMTR